MRRILRGALKPPPGTPINWRSPLSRGLILGSFLNDGAGDPSDLVYPKANGAINGTLPWRPTAVGLGLSHDGSDSNFLNYGNPAKLQFTEASSFSIHVIATVGTGGSSTFRNLMRNDPGGITRTLCIFRLDSSNLIDFKFGSTGGTLGSQVGGTAVAEGVSRVRHFTAVRDVAADTIQVYLDGILDGSGTDASTGSWTINSANWLTKFISGGEPLSGIYCAVLFWDRALGAREVQDLYLDPWQLLARSIRVQSPSDTVAPPAPSGHIGARFMQPNSFGVQMFGGG